MVTATPHSSGGDDLMGIGDRAQLHTSVQSNLYSRTGLSSDYDSSHPHLSECLPFLCERNNRAMVTKDGHSRRPCIIASASLQS